MRGIAASKRHGVSKMRRLQWWTRVLWPAFPRREKDENDPVIFLEQRMHLRLSLFYTTMTMKAKVGVPAPKTSISRFHRRVFALASCRMVLDWRILQINSSKQRRSFPWMSPGSSQPRSAVMAFRSRQTFRNKKIARNILVE